MSVHVFPSVALHTGWGGWGGEQIQQYTNYSAEDTLDMENTEATIDSE